MSKLKKIDNINIEDIIALTSLQEGMLFHYLQNPQRESYFEQLNLEISGEIDVGIFEKAWNFVVETNEMLRTLFRWEKLEKPAQVVLKKYNPDLRFFDLSTIDHPGEQKKQLEKIKLEDRKEKFDLRKVPFRVILCKVSGKHYQMVISNHHILYDGWSSGVILKEFFQAYNVLKKAETVPMPGVKPPFKEFIKWHQNRDKDKQKKFWEEYLEGFDTQTGLTIKRKELEGDSGEAAVKVSRLILEKGITDKLDIFLKEKRVTLAAFFYCAWGILVQKYCGSEDVLFGTTAAGRSAPIKGIENMVGLFINTLPLRVTAKSGETLLNLLLEINDTLPHREKYENTPLVEIQEYSRRETGQELFDSLLVMENYPVDRWLMEENNPLSLTVHSYSIVETTTYDLTIGILIGDEIEIIFNYNKELFEKSSIRRLSQHFTNIIKRILREPGSEIYGLEILSEEEKNQVLYDLNNTAVKYPKDKRIHRLFEEQAQKSPDNIALIFADKELTYRELDKRANQLIPLLQSKGFEPNTIVGLLLERSLEMIVGILGILKSGGAYLPMDPDYPEERISYMLADSGTNILLTTPNLSEKFEKSSIGNCQLLMVNEEAYSINNYQLTINNLQLEGNNLAYVIYTSGSTGKPKGVLVEHSSVVNLAYSQKDQYKINKTDRILQFSAIYFDASVEQIFITLFSGAGLVLIDKDTLLDASQFEVFIASRSITHLNAIPSFLSNMVLKDIYNLKRIISGGDVCHVDLAKRWSRYCDFYNVYGPTETTVTCITLRLEDVDESLPRLPVGRPLNNIRVYLLDKWMEPVPFGVIGELYIGGDGVARGYLNRPELTCEKFHQDLWDLQDYPLIKNYKLQITNKAVPSNQKLLRGVQGGSFLEKRPPGRRRQKIYKTGDLGRWLPDENIEFSGRIDQQVKVRGFRIELGEIENQLLQHEAIKQAVVLAKDDKGGDKYLAAYIVSEEISLPGLREYLLKVLPGYMVPSYFMRLDEIPLTPTGKIHHGALPEPEKKTGETYTAPGDEIERKLADLWAEVLCLSDTGAPVGIDNNFFALGGHSLKATVLVSRIHKVFNVKLPLARVFKSPTIRGLAGYIRRAVQDRYHSIEAIEKRDYYWLSSAQKRLYFLHRMDETSVVYNLSAVWVLEGAVDRQRLEATFRKLVQRHESLRTSFAEIQGEPIQRIHKEVEFEVEYHDSCTMRPASAVKAFVRSFDLSRAPLMRVGLINSDTRHLLMVDMHHIISDGASIGVMLNEFTALSGNNELPRLKLRYRDYSQWQANENHRRILKKQEEFWLRQMRGEIPGLQLPFDFPRPALQRFEGSTHRFEIGSTETIALKHFALAQDATLFMVLLSVVNIFLTKLSGQEDILIGTPVAGRRHPDLETIAGMFVNTVVLRNRPTGHKTIKEFLKEVSHNILDAFENQDYQYEDLVEKLEVERDAGRNPLFDTAMAYQNQENSQLQIPKLTIERYPHENEISRFDMTLFFEEKEDTIQVLVEYSIYLFKPSTIERFSGYFKKLVSTVINRPELVIGEIEIISAEEKKQVLYQFNNTAVYPPDKTIHRLYEQQAERSPDQIALAAHGPGRRVQSVDEERTALYTAQFELTYRELNEKADSLARFLSGQGAKPNDFIGLVMDKSSEMIISILGILKTGGAYVPLNPKAPTARAKYILEECRANLVLTDSLSKELGELCQVSQGIELSPGFFNSLPGKSEDMPAPESAPGHFAYVIFTSGSTGKPKGVPITHANFSPLMHWGYEHLGLGPLDRTIQNLSYYFDWSVWEIFITLTTGACLYPVSENVLLNAQACTGFMNTHAITVLHITPSQYQYLEPVIREMLPGGKLESLKYLFIGAEKLTYDLVRKSFESVEEHCRVFNMYGPTEATIISAVLEIYRSDYEQFSSLSSVPIGIPVANCILIILDKYLQLCPVNIVGELYIGGDGLAVGYLGAPEKSSGSFIKNKYKFAGIGGQRLYKTGDLCRWMPGGNIEFLGRLDFQVKIRGFRIELGEIENCLLTYPGIKEAFVTARENRKKEKYLCAYVVPDYEFTISALREFLSKELPGYMIPSYFMKIKRIPLTANGKIDRKALPEPGIENKNKEYRSPQNPVEEGLVKIWKELLDLEKGIGIDDNFFELGGHSLKATTLAAKIHQTFGIKVPLPEIFISPSIEGLAKYIRTAKQETFVPIEPVEKKEYYGLSSAQNRLYILDRMGEVGTSYNIPYTVQLEGVLNRSRLEQAFLELIRRHESLRTSFHIIDGKTVQKVHNEVEFEIEYHSAERREERRAPCAVRCTSTIKAFIRTFDLSRAPLIRVGIIKVEEEQHTLMVDMHHITADGMSMEILVHDFSASYSRRKLPGIKLHYKDYAGWQNREKELEKSRQQGEYWKKEFENEIPVLELPTDYTRPAVQSFEGNSMGFAISAETFAGLKKLGIETGATLYMVLISLYAVFLSKLSNQEDIVIGSPVAGRRHADLEKIIGMFVNTLALRNYPSGEKKFIAFLAEVKENTLKAFENQDYQYEELVELVSVKKDTSRNPLFDTMFVLQDLDMPEIEVPGLKLKPAAYEQGISKFDLMLQCIETADKHLSFNFEYCTKLFKKETIERFTGYFKKIVSNVIENPGTKISTVEIISTGEKNRLLVDFNRSEAQYPRFKTVHQLFAEQVEKTPGNIAVVGPPQMKNRSYKSYMTYISYQELNRKSNQLARVLRAEGINTDSVVGLMVEPDVEMMIGIMAILKSGGAYLPINPTLPPGRIQYILKDSAISLLLSYNNAAGEIAFKGTVFQLENQELYNSAPSNPDYEYHPKNLAYVIYTSGSTGQPKGTGVEHSQLVNFLYHMYNRYDRSVDSRDRCLSLTNIMFDVSVWEFFLPLVFGAQLVLMPEQERFDVFALTRTLVREEITLAYLPPGLLKEVNQQLKKQPGKVKLNKMLVGVEPIRDEVLEDYMRLNPHMKIINGYGPTETTICATSYNYLSHEPEGEIVPIGVPLSNNQVVLLDSAGYIVPQGIPGEICVSGDGVSRGYLNNPQLTAEKFCLRRPGGTLFVKTVPPGPPCKNFLLSPLPYYPLYRTGDLARLLPDGNIRFIGRRDHQVKIRGYRIELGEIESRLLKHNHINQALVLEKTDEKSGKYLCAYIIADIKLEISDLHKYLSQDLPDYMLPSYFVQLEKIPLTPNGKVDRSALPEPDPGTGTAVYTAPRDAVESKLAKIWQEVLDLAELPGIDTDFFQLGGHSLRATILASRVHKAFNVKVPLTEIFTTPTIRGLSQYIKEAKEERYAAIKPVEKQEYYALSPAQQRLYILHRMEPDNVSYNIPQVMPLPGKIDKEKLESSFRQLIRHHESLRTSFEMLAEKPVQRINEKVDFEIKYDFATENRGEAISDFIRPFDLSQAPLLRVGLIQNGDPGGNYILLVDMHHIITDAASQAILKDEFNRLYPGKAQDLPPLRLQYKDYARWQNSEIQQALIKEQETYWLKMFAHEVPVLNLPTDYPRPVIQSFEGGVVEFLLTGKEKQTLKALAKETDSTLYMCILSVFTILLSKLSGQEDIVIGTPVAARRHADLEKIIGMFVNTLALRNKPSGEKKFKEFLKELKDQTLEAYENQEYQFEELVDKISLRRDTGRNPVFDVMFNLLNQEGYTYTYTDDIPGCEKKETYQYNHRKGTSKFDLTLTAVDLGERLLFTFEYCTKLFEPGTIDRFISYFKRILASLSEDANRKVWVIETPDKKISEIDILPEEEKRQLVIYFNDTAEECPTHKIIYQLFEDRVDETPDHVALVFNDKSMTFRQFDERANQLANYLTGEKCIRPGDRVAVLMDRSVELIVTLMGVMKAGGAYVPLDVSLPGERLRVVFNDASIEVVVSRQKYLEKLTMVKSGCKGLSSILSMDRIGNELNRSPSSRPEIGDADGPAYVMYTSGSSGTPKGVLVEHRTIVNTLDWRRRFYEYSPGNVSLQVPPYFFDSSITDIFTPLLGGARLVLVSEKDRFDLVVLKELITGNKVSHFIVVPAFYNVLLEEIADYLKSVKMITCAGEHFPDELIRKHFEKLPGVRIFNEYGPTENSVNSTVFELEADSPKALIGKPISNVRVYILDRYLHLNPIGVIGEICLSGSSLARGYLNRPELTAEKFVINSNSRFYRTGDMGKWLSDGNLEFLGRIDTQVKIRGVRVETGEIENHLMRHEDIKEAVVLAHKGIDGNKYLCAYVVLANVKPDADADLKLYLSGKLPEYMIPSHFIVLDAIPFTPTGKINREAFPEPRLSTKGHIAPRNQVEERLAKIWADILDIQTDTIGSDSDFFQLGGHSLKATIAASRIHKAFNVKVPLAEIFTHPTLRGMAKYIGRAGQERFAAIEPVEKKEYYPLSPAQKRLHLLQQMDLNNIAYNLPMFITLTETPGKERLESAFKKLIERHESLSTSFEMTAEEPVQRVHEEVEFEIDYYDSQVIDAGDRCRWEEEPFGQINAFEEPGTHHSSKNRIIHHSFIRPFDLSSPPLLRVGLIQERGPGGNCTLMIDMHHIITDGASHVVLKDEFNMLYTGKAQDLPLLRLQYKDYAQWQNRERQSEVIKRQETYWLKEFNGEVPVLQLPTDYPRPFMQSFAGRTVEFTLSPQENQRLKSLAKKTNATLYMSLLAAFNILLSKLSGQEDIIVGTPIMGRRHTDLERIIGIFVNTLAMKNQPCGEKRFKDFLSHVKERTLSAYENQDYQFEDLVDKINVVRDIGRNPLFDVMFNLLNMEEYTYTDDFPGSAQEETCQYNHRKGTSKFDLTLTAVDLGERLLFTFEYCTKLFSPNTIDRFISYFKRILASLSEDSARKVSEIDIITETEKHRLLYEFNDTSAQYPKDMTIRRWFEEQVTGTPDHVALIGTALGARSTEGKKHIHLTYKELNRKSNRLAEVFRYKGVKTGSIVGLMVNRSIQMMVGLLAILKAGAAYLPIDSKHPQQRLEYMLRDSDSRVILTDTEEVPVIPTLVKIDPYDLDKYKAKSSPPCAAGYPTDLAYTIYTSGTTGKPKGVMIENRSLVNFIKGITDVVPFQESDSILSLTTISFDIFGLETILPLTKGSKVVIGTEEEQLDAGSAAKVMENENITIFQTTPSRLQLFIMDSEAAKRLRRLKYLLVGGEALPDILLKKLGKLTEGKIYNVYGPTETTIWSTLKDVSAGKSLNIGKPISNTYVYILSRSGSLQPLGVGGELSISGDGLARGYLNKPELTNDKFLIINDKLKMEKVPFGQPMQPCNHASMQYQSSPHFLIPPLPHSPIYPTGDLARWLEDGNIEFLGRMDFQVKIRGFRIELGEIENCLTTHPGIKDTIVIDRNDNERQYLCAYVTAAPTPGKGIPSIHELKEHLEGKLPGYMIPACFVSIESIPLTPSGKVDRNQLPRPLESDFHTQQTYEAPISSIQRIIAEIWQEVLGREKVGTQDNFFDLGGNSLDFIKISNKLKEKLELEIPVLTLFTYPTIRSLELYLTREQGVEEDDPGLIDEGKDIMQLTLKKLDNGD